MATRKLVFGSKAERIHFQALKQGWPQYHVYHNLPFLQVFELPLPRNPSKPSEAEQITISRLKKTSIDFVVCDKDDAPLLAIDFDGLEEGFSVGTSYMPRLHCDRWRKTISELKLSEAHASRFPYVILGSRQFATVDADSQLTVVDALVGGILAHKKALQSITEGFRPEDMGMTWAEFKLSNERQQHETLQEWVIQVETVAEIEHNPVAKRACILSEQLGVKRWRYAPLTMPDMSHLLDVRERIKAFEDLRAHGCRCTVENDICSATATAWLPNFKAPGVCVIGLVEELGKLVALCKLRDKMRNHKA